MTIKPGSTIGIIGGGQLGRMTAVAASELGYKVHIYTDKKNSPASHVAYKTTVADYEDKKALAKFAKSVDVVTFEFENIPHESVKILEETVPVRPGWKVLHIAQHRIREKDFMNSIGVGTAPYRKVKNADDLAKAYNEIGPKCILKTVELGYDGKGQQVIDENSDLKAVWKKLGVKTAILEGMVEFTKEISVITARTENGSLASYVPVENIHKSGILDVTIAPAEIERNIAEKAWQIAHNIAESLNLVGMVAVEMFLTKKGELLVNEIAPRPHNSGHWTMDACITGQFEQLVRAVCGLPLGNTYYMTSAVMKNLIGDDIKLYKEFINDPDCKVHIYGKKETRAGRKMGHVTHLMTEVE